ncbi:MAG TPA: single-stranded-DNA-specific exonuclease RecJ [Planctomycetota bacterium]|nr:single-stranded-DNA-specific exonuclease RecJ [Planctomycetota bacterium]
MPVTTGGSRWKLRAPAPDRRGALADALRVSPITAQLLINRGLVEAGAAGRFLEASFEQLHQPELLPDMDRAVERLLAAVSGRRRVLVYGDADADGLAATAIMARLLSMLGCPVETFIPCRLADGYGLSPETVERIVAARPDLVVTVDCGITSRSEVATLRAAGIGVVVTDHHQPRGGDLPEADAVVAPRRPGSAYPFPDICGAAVAFKLAWGLAQALSPGRRVSPECREFLNDATALVALGTVADVCPLLDENRVMVRYGLKAMTASRHAGLASLVAASRRRYNASRRALTSRDVAWGLAPAVNSAGRLGRPEVALQLLMATDPAVAERLAAELSALNEQRRALGRAVADEAMAAADELGDAPVIVLCSDTWHGGVVGLAAAKLAERFGRPAAVVTFDGQYGRGSARGPKGSRLHELFAACAEHLEDHGGHDGAAGFSVRRDRFEAFRTAFLKVAGERLSAAVPADDALEIDAEVPAAELSCELADEVCRLAPFGEANPEPVLATLGARIAGTPQAIGSGRTASLRIRAGQGGGSVRAVGFGWAQHLAELAELGRAGRLDLAYTLKLDERSGEPEMILEAYRART